GDSFPAHRAVPPDGTAAPARRGGDCGNSAGPSIAGVADCEDPDIGCRAATRRSGRRFNQRLPEVCTPFASIHRVNHSVERWGNAESALRSGTMGLKRGIPLEAWTPWLADRACPRFVIAAMQTPA